MASFATTNGTTATDPIATTDLTDLTTAADNGECRRYFDGILHYRRHLSGEANPAHLSPRSLS